MLVGFAEGDYLRAAIDVNRVRNDDEFDHLGSFLRAGPYVVLPEHVGLDSKADETVTV